MSKYRDRFRVESTRILYQDYAQTNYYYVTVNTINHEHYFGKIIDGKILLNEVGRVTEKEWLKTAELRDNVELDYYVIMPNHIHGIIFIEGCENAETRCGVSQGNANKNEFSHLRKNSLSVIINQFKGSVTKWCNKNGFPDFQWQRLFYERIIRSDKDLFQIRKYIKENPLRWEFEKGYSDNLEL